MPESTWVWDEIGGEWQHWDGPDYPAGDEHQGWRLVASLGPLKNVREYRSDRNHLGVSVQALTKSGARIRALLWCNAYRKWKQGHD